MKIIFPLLLENVAILLLILSLTAHNCSVKLDIMIVNSAAVRNIIGTQIFSQIVERCHFITYCQVSQVLDTAANVGGLPLDSNHILTLILHKIWA